MPENIRLNYMHNFIMKIPGKQELQQAALNKSWDVDFKDFMNRHKKFTTKSYSFFVIYVILASDNPSRFRKNVSERII